MKSVIFLFYEIFLILIDQTYYSFAILFARCRRVKANYTLSILIEKFSFLGYPFVLATHFSQRDGCGQKLPRCCLQTQHSWSAASPKAQNGGRICKGVCFNTEQVVELIFLDDTDLERTQSHESDSKVEEDNLSDNYTQSERHKKHLSS